MINERYPNPSQQEQKIQEKKLGFLVSQMQKTKQKLPIYDAEGNLLWPRQMSYEEVKQFIAERNAKKQQLVSDESQEEPPIQPEELDETS